MKGIVFREFLEMVASRHGGEAADQLRLRLERPRRAPGLPASRDDADAREIQALVAALSAQTGQPATLLLRQFGQHLAARFVRLYPHFFTLQPTLWDFLASVEPVVRVDLRPLYPGAELPRFVVRARREGGLEGVYRATHPLPELAQGLIEGVARHYRTPVTIACHPQADGIVFDITAQEHLLVD